MLYGGYYLPASLDDAIRTLGDCEGTGIIIAGGTDIIPKLRDVPSPEKVLVDITRIEALQRVEMREGAVRIGSCVTFADLEKSKIVIDKLTALAEASAAVGSVQIRNQGTLGGNVVSALPAADGAIALVALGAVARVYSERGILREEKILDLYKGPGECCLDCAKEIIVDFVIALPLEAKHGTSFVRLCRRKALALPTLNCAVSVGVRSEKITECRIAVGPVARIPFRATSAERVLVGEKMCRAVVRRAAEEASRHSQPQDSLFRGSAEYRKEMVKIAVERALTTAVQRAAFGD
jgi:CO/xanthine dehydrogenase FAD-binding subunit